MFNKFPGIKKVALEMAYSNGMINRFKTEEQWLNSVECCLEADGVYHADLVLLDTWIQSLTEEQIMIFVYGEETEMDALESLSPNKEVCKIFLDMFEH